MGLESFDMSEENSGSKYTSITKEEFDEFINSLPYDFEEKRSPNAKEYIYSLKGVVDGRQDITLQVMSTVHVDSNVSRAKGKDAIRTVLMKTSTRKPVGGRTKTLRIPTWRKNLRKKIESLVEETSKYYTDCPECDGFLVKRTGKHGEFLGCTNYPQCDETAQVNE